MSTSRGSWPLTVRTAGWDPSRPRQTELQAAVTTPPTAGHGAVGREPVHTHPLAPRSLHFLGLPLGEQGCRVPAACLDSGAGARPALPSFPAPWPLASALTQGPQSPAPGGQEYLCGPEVTARAGPGAAPADQGAQVAPPQPLAASLAYLRTQRPFLHLATVPEAPQPQRH